MSKVSLTTNQAGFANPLGLIRIVTVVVAGLIFISLAIGLLKVLAGADSGSIAIPHANSDDNPLPHIVYEIFVVYPNGIYDVLKYGISCQTDFVTKDGNPRPEYQIPAIKKMPDYKNCKVWYKILQRNVPDRLAAKALEQNYVDNYYVEHGFLPDLQKRPSPTLLKK